MPHDPITAMKLAMKFFEAGVVPLGLDYVATATSVPPHFDIEKLLADLPPEEARTMRRKFRKLWRKMAAAAKKRPGRKSRNILRFLGHGASVPTKRHKQERKRMVLTSEYKKISKKI